MKGLGKIIAAILVAASSVGVARAQYYQMASQLQRVISPALSRSLNYKGFVDASYLKGVGNRNADYLEVTTTQGFKYADWFFMGVGAGVEVVFSNPKSQFTDWDSPLDGVDFDGFDRHKGHTRTGWVIPLFTDFRFNIGSPADVGFFVDLRLGCSFLLSDKYLEIGNGYMTNTECFYLRPSLGIRIPVSASNPRQAVNIGISYQLTTSDYWYYHSSSSTLNSVGVNIGFEW
ncbi:MAG: hypothetical protein K2L78_01365 [Muribaculaceae bacterium]|nr:hypothetical protein [Muribaculaceae bacterium]